VLQEWAYDKTYAKSLITLTAFFSNRRRLPIHILRLESIATLARQGKTFDDALYTGSRERLELAKLWLSSCIENHMECRRWIFSRDLQLCLPSRVIDVGPEDGSQDPFLYETSSATGAYVALSHRWGESKVNTLTTKTRSDREKGIPMGDMPQTFKTPS
jgi:hypothetical protein